MDPGIRGRVDRLLETYSVYYDVEPARRGGGPDGSAPFI